MKIIKLNSQNPEKAKIRQIKGVLENDGIIVYPTDTIYGLGANIYSETAVGKIYSLKNRDYLKPLSVCLSEIEDIEKVAYLKGKDLIAQILPGPFTIILKKKEHIPSFLTAGSEKIGIRIPDNNICREITREFPITSTSANLSGEKVPKSVNEIKKQLGSSVDLIIDGGPTKGIPSTVIDLTSHPPKILREGVENLKI